MEVKAAFPLWDRWEGQARKGRQALATCLSCLSLSMGCPQRKRAKVCPLCPAWGFQQLAMSSLDQHPRLQYPLRALLGEEVSPPELLE